MGDAENGTQISALAVDHEHAKQVPLQPYSFLLAGIVLNFCLK